METNVLSSQSVTKGLLKGHFGISSGLTWLAANKAYAFAGVLSYTIISLEIIWTRIFAVHFLYAFAFLVLSLAMLGSGLGALVLRLVPVMQSPKSIPCWTLTLVTMVFISLSLVAHIDVDFSKVFLQWSMAARLVLILFVLSATYFAGGICMALLFRTHHEQLARLYMVDLIGAAAGALGAVLLMNSVGVPVAMVLSLIPLLGLTFCLNQGKIRGVAVLLAGLCVVLPVINQEALSRTGDQTLPRIHSHWDAMGLINVYTANNYRLIRMDLASEGAVRPFDGQVASLQNQSFLFDMKPLIDRLGPDVSLVSIGSGGGTEVLMALKNNVAEIYAVEVNPYLNRMLTDGILTDYSGKLYQHQNVKVITEDARPFIRRFENRFDIISSLSSNTWSALGSGAFAMAENYLFTVEAFEDYLRALNPQGVLIIEHQVYGPRLVTQALIALERQGITDPNQHLAVFSLPKQKTTVMMVSKQPLLREHIQQSFLALTPGVGPDMIELYPEPHPDAHLYFTYIINDGWEAVSAYAPIDLSPATDDRPFIAQLGLMKNLTWDSFDKLELFEYNGFPVAKLIIISILGVVCILFLPLTFIPYLRKGPKLSSRAWAYFFAIGVAFMSVEVTLLQSYCLFVGYSAYTMAVLLIALLMGAGLGSRWSHRFGTTTPFIAITIWIGLQMTLWGPLTEALGSQTLLIRILITLLLVTPLGFFMGMPFPKGSRRIGPLVDWAMAVNGSASVVGGSGILLISFAYGLTQALLCGVGMYAVAMVLLKSKAAWIIEK